MKLKEIKEILSAQVIIKGSEELEILKGCGADLMSDVLAFSKEKTVLLTGLTNPQVIRTAEMIDLSLIIFVRGKQPPQETIDLAKEKNIPLMTTSKPLYQACGLLYSAGLRAEKLSKLE
ncbi:DRTGG domain-containing protein [Orenia marismortui]|uniref:DRTGG domain-containing protein n=1 Tax=Orenia marismortui TaxID=46469 RepID=A0A4R8H3E5_9FIRM|nr:DRTGG domain-containing protein [Orenia marismortui]TDX49030.1 DRTGG domain-containing protein [Orenia marismortui]